jgi:hypothetical protein
LFQAVRQLADGTRTYFNIPLGCNILHVRFIFPLSPELKNLFSVGQSVKRLNERIKGSSGYV